MREGYRFCPGRPVEPGVYYKYYREGFHVVLVIDPENDGRITPEQHQAIETQVLGSFYHPQQFLADFPDGFPVYHVEMLTLLTGGEERYVRELCAACRNMWAYRPGAERLLIYENQPGDFFGLRGAIETMISGRTASAGNPASGRWGLHGRIPYVTITLVVINVLTYLIMELAGDTRDAAFIMRYGGLYPPYVSDGRQWWRMLTAGFIHFGAAHLVNNMVILYCMGERLEHAVGHVRLAVIYVLSLLGGNLLSYVMALMTSGYSGYAVSAGASGAVFGLIGGFLWIVLLHRGHLEGISAKRIIFMILLMIYYGFTSGGIDNWGHIGGVLTGFFVTIVLTIFHRRNDQTG